MPNDRIECRGTKRVFDFNIVSTYQPEDSHIFLFTGRYGPVICQCLIC